MFQNLNKQNKIIDVGYRIDLSAATLAPQLLLSKVLTDGIGVIYDDTLSGYTSGSYKELVSLLTKHNQLIQLSETINEHNKDIMYYNDNSLVQLTMGASGNFNVSAYSLNKEFVELLIKDFEGMLSDGVKKGYIFAIMRGAGGGLQLTRIGYAGSPLERPNYNQKVVEDYDYAIADLKSSSPSGRITILDGPSGSGKTYMTRAILTEVPDAMFVLVPPSMVSSLGGPDLLPLLLANKENYQKTGPTVLILEDADECLVPRASDNMNSISSILNLGDGIFGSLFDIRIIATTNAKKAEMDSAVIRDGRLSKHIHIGHLTFEEANAVYQRLLPGKELPKNEEHRSEFRPVKGDKITLANVYKIARDNGWIPPKAENKSNQLFIDDYDY